jgi:hypothetical protein
MQWPSICGTGRESIHGGVIEGGEQMQTVRRMNRLSSVSRLQRDWGLLRGRMGSSSVRSPIVRVAAGAEGCKGGEGRNEDLIIDDWCTTPGTQGAEECIMRCETKASPIVTLQKHREER